MRDKSTFCFAPGVGWLDINDVSTADTTDSVPGAVGTTGAMLVVSEGVGISGGVLSVPGGLGTTGGVLSGCSCGVCSVVLSPVPVTGSSVSFVDAVSPGATQLVPVKPDSFCGTEVVPLRTTGPGSGKITYLFGVVAQ